MNFDLTEEQKAIGETAASLFRNLVPQDSVVAIAEANALDPDIWSKVAALGIGGILVSTEDGGLGLDLLTLAAIQEEAGYTALPVPLSENALAAWLIAECGNDQLRARWLDRLISGSAIAAFALQEDDGISPDDWSLASPLLCGTKLLVAWGAVADLIIVGTEGGALRVVEAAKAGVNREPVTATDGSRPLADIGFTDMDAELLTDDRDRVNQLLDAIYVLLAADAVGAGQRALRLAVDYAKERSQFGRLIGTFQGLKHQLADMTAETEPLRYLVWHAAHSWDIDPAMRGYIASLAKAHATDVAVRTARRTVEAHGGIGYTWEYPLHIFLKRSMYDRTAFGLPAMHRIRSAELAGWDR